MRDAIFLYWFNVGALLSSILIFKAPFPSSLYYSQSDSGFDGIADS